MWKSIIRTVVVVAPRKTDKAVWKCYKDNILENRVKPNERGRWECFFNKSSAFRRGCPLADVMFRLQFDAKSCTNLIVYRLIGGADFGYWVWGLIGGFVSSAFLINFIQFLGQSVGLLCCNRKLINKFIIHSHHLQTAETRKNLFFSM